MMLPGGTQRGGESRGLGRVQLCNFGGSTQFLEPGFPFLLKQGYWLKDEYRASQLRRLRGSAAAIPASLPSRPTSVPPPALSGHASEVPRSTFPLP